MPEEQGIPMMTNRSWIACYNKKGELHFQRVHIVKYAKHKCVIHMIWPFTLARKFPFLQFCGWNSARDILSRAYNRHVKVN